MYSEKELIRLLRSAALMPRDRSVHPRIGDTVVEATRFDPDPEMIGVLEKIEETERDGRIFYVRTPSGSTQRWLNADALAIKISDVREECLKASIRGASSCEACQQAQKEKRDMIRLFGLALDKLGGEFIIEEDTLVRFDDMREIICENNPEDGSIKYRIKAIGLKL